MELEQSNNSPQPFGGGFSSNTLIKGRWKILRKIGQGAFGTEEEFLNA
jgi:hypothetical protein